MARKTKKGKRTRSGLFDPGQVLTGRQMRRAARAAARIELRPSLKAYSREADRIQRQARREQIGLRRLGNQTSRQVGQVYGRTNRQLQAGVGNARQSGQGLIAGTAADAAASTKRMEDLQSSTLGGQLESLAGMNVDPGQSASQQAMAQAISGRQQDARNTNDAFAGLARQQAVGMEMTANNQLQANQMQGAEAQAAIRSAIMSRRADSRAASGDARREVFGKIADVKALFGPTILNNLMRLRDSERSFVNERAALMQDAQAQNQDNALGWYKAKHPGDSSGGGDGGGKGSEEWDDRTLTGKEYQQFAAAANEILGNGRVRPGHWQQFLDKLGSQEGVNWSPIERRKFKRRYKKRKGY